jgi:hypothetical protein
MKSLIVIAVAILICADIRAQHKLEKIWETDSIVAVPESVLPDLKKGILYISLIDGPGWEADGKGGVGRLGVDGKKYEAGWITGLNAPKGSGIVGNRLYVADIKEVVVIDIQNGKIEKKNLSTTRRALMILPLRIKELYLFLIPEQQRSGA